MKTSILLATFLGIAANAYPAVVPEAEVERRQLDFSDERDELSGPCKPVTVIFARGTLELGNVGSLAGPPFFNALDDIIGASNLAVQGVDYGATIAGYLEGGDPAGAATLASLTNQAASQCPSTQIVLSGYSQGAQVVHLGAQQLSASVASHVSAVVLFGDPDDNQPINDIAASEVDTFCFSTDEICKGLPIVLPAHLSYSVDAVPAAEFVAAHVTV